MKMENIAPTAGIAPISLAFWVGVLTITPLRLLDLDATTGPTHHPGKSCNTYNYINTGSHLTG